MQFSGTKGSTSNPRVSSTRSGLPTIMKPTRAKKWPRLSSSDPHSNELPRDEEATAAAAAAGGEGKPSRRKRRRKGPASFGLPPPQGPGRDSEEKPAQPFPQLGAFEPRYWPNEELRKPPPPRPRLSLSPAFSSLPSLPLYFAPASLPLLSNPGVTGNLCLRRRRRRRHCGPKLIRVQSPPCLPLPIPNSSSNSTMPSATLSVNLMRSTTTSDRA